MLLLTHPLSYVHYVKESSDGSWQGLDLRGDEGVRVSSNVLEGRRMLAWYSSHSPAELVWGENGTQMCLMDGCLCLPLCS